MAQTLEQRIKSGLARHQFSLDDYRDHPVDCHLHCWCGDSLLIDYFHFGMGEMSRRLTSFIAKHEVCKPKDDGE
jgi:hypothetical protein